MSPFDKALAFVLRQEGGYVNDPDDPGGATNYGVTQKAFDRWLASIGREPYPVKEIVSSDVRLFYHDWYWVATKADEMDWPLQLVFFDGAVNKGAVKHLHEQDTMSRLLQRAAGVDVDGMVGPKTLAAAKDVSPHDLLWARVGFYRRLAKRKRRLLKFLPGWIRRMENLHKEILGVP